MKIGNISFLYNPRPLGIKVLSLAVICFLFFIPAKIIFTPNDHAGYLEYIDQVKSDGVSDEAKGKVYVGLVYSYIGKVIPYGVFTNIVFLVFIIIFSSRVRNYFTLLAVGVLVAPISAYFGYVTKEALILLILVLAHLCYSRRGRKAGVIVMLAMLFLFSIFVRIYYLPFIIIAVFIAQFGMRRVLLPSFFFGVVGLLLFPEVLSFLYVTKYEMWARLKFESSVVTLFPLSFSPFSSPAVFFEIWLQNVWSIVSAPVRHFGFRGGGCCYIPYFSYLLCSQNQKNM